MGGEKKVRVSRERERAHTHTRAPGVAATREDLWGGEACHVPTVRKLSRTSWLSTGVETRCDVLLFFLPFFPLAPDAYQRFVVIGERGVVWPINCWGDYFDGGTRRRRLGCSERVE